MPDSEDYEAAVEWFTGLEDAGKGRILQSIGGEAETLSNEEVQRLNEIIIQVQDYLVEGGQEHAVEQLVDDGFSDAYGQILAQNTLKHTPPEELKVEGLQSVERVDFDKIVRRAVTEYIDHFEEGIEISDSEDLELDARHLVNTVQDAFMSYMRGNAGLEKIEAAFVENGVSEERAAHMVEQFAEHEDEVFRRLAFRNIQDIKFREIRDLKDQQRRTRQLMDDILTLLENAAQSD